MKEIAVKTGKKSKANQTSFKPGNNANPYGRPRIPDTITEVLRTRLMYGPGTPPPEPKTRLEVIAEHIISRCQRGDGDARDYNLLMDRAFGKPLQTIEAKVESKKPAIEELCETVPREKIKAVADAIEAARNSSKH